MSYMSARLTHMAEKLSVTDDDRIVLRDAAFLLGATNLGDVARLLLTDDDALRGGLEQLEAKEMGTVLAVVLAVLVDREVDPRSLLPKLAEAITNDNDLARDLGIALEET